MIDLLSKLFIKNYQDTQNGGVRIAYGMLCGILGICFNLLLFFGKFFAGILSGSISITADAFNNLSDGAGSIISLIGFHMSGQEPDQDHPFGHGRIEYIAGLIISVLIFVVSFELFKSSLSKILHPEELNISPFVLLFLVLSIAVKFYMFLYNRKIGKRISSATLMATAADSISDTVATLVVLLTTLLAWFTGLNLDGYCGILVSLFIAYTGFTAARDTIGPLLGEAPDPDFVKEISAFVLSHEPILGVHDVIVHNYGPGRLFLSLHAEVSADNDIFQIHDIIDAIEQELTDRYRCMPVIHMDPVRMGDDATRQLHDEICDLLTRVLTQFPSVHKDDISLHDFRYNSESDPPKLSFDIVIPYGFPLTDEELKERLRIPISESHPELKIKIHVDKEKIEKGD